MDLHAWFEAFVGGYWHTFDAAQPPEVVQMRLEVVQA